MILGYGFFNQDMFHWFGLSKANFEIDRYHLFRFILPYHFGEPQYSYIQYSLHVMVYEILKKNLRNILRQNNSISLEFIISI